MVDGLHAALSAESDGERLPIRRGEDRRTVKRPRVAVLLAVYNRVATTLRCLYEVESLRGTGQSVEIFLVDDGSSDGTGREVAMQFPAVHLSHGDGTLFWGGGMHRVFGEALAGEFDYYLLLNDDTRLDPAALEVLLATEKEAMAALQRPAIVVGSVADPSTGEFSYGGWTARRGGVWPFSWPSWQKTPPDPVRWKECATMNGNCVLIPHRIATQVGNLDPAFRHVGGDLDYGLRARQAGYPVVIAPGFIGVCELNRAQPPWLDRSRSLGQRWAALRGPKGFPPSGWGRFVRRHKGALWLLPWLLPYARFWLGELRALLPGRS